MNSWNSWKNNWQHLTEVLSDEQQTVDDKVIDEQSQTSPGLNKGCSSEDLS